MNYNAHSLTPKVAVDWQATPDALVYASITNGYKSGGFNSGTRWGPGNGLPSRPTASGHRIRSGKYVGLRSGDQVRLV